MGQSINILQNLVTKLEGGLNPYFAALENDKTLLDLGQKLEVYTTEVSLAFA